MVCIDCHGARDVMGDGNLYGAMEDAVEVECSDCHGTFEQVSTLTTSRGRPLRNVERRGDIFVLTGKADGKARRVKQAHDVIDPEHPRLRPARGRRDDAGARGPAVLRLPRRLEHGLLRLPLDRNLGFTQLDLASGTRTEGRVTTQERVFATQRQLTLGVDASGKVAPFQVAFSSMGTVHAKDGTLLLDEACRARPRAFRA